MSTPLYLAFTPGYNWVVGEIVTEDKLNLAANPTFALYGTIGSTTLGANAIQEANFQTGCVSTRALADGSVTTVKLANANVTVAKLDQAAAADVHQYAAGTYAADTLPACIYTVTLSPARSGAYVAGEVVRFKADAANTGATNVNINTRGAANIKTAAGAELGANQIAADQVVNLVYNGTDFEILNPNPAKTFVSSEISIAVGAITPQAHGLGVVPALCRWVLVCKTAPQTNALGYAVGDEVDIWAAGVSQPNWAPGADATNIFMGINTAATSMIKKDGSNYAAITPSEWRLKCYARATL